jgi:cytochrome bd-type quinol oxidase subunit 1
VNDARARAEMVDFGAFLTNSTAVGAFVHTITACFVTAGIFVMALTSAGAHMTPSPTAVAMGARIDAFLLATAATPPAAPSLPDVVGRRPGHCDVHDS